MKKIVLFFILFSAVLAAIVTLSLFRTVDVPTTSIKIMRGETAGMIATKLHEQGIIRNRDIFYIYVKFSRSATELSYGNYLFEGRLSLLDVHKKLTSGDVILHKVTIPEGLTVKKTAELLAAKNIGELDEFLKLGNDPEFAKKLTGFEINSLEGFLYPETYHFPSEATEAFILTHMVKQYFSATSNINFKPLPNLDYYQTIIMASIVECEAKYVAEQPTIASVYLNRVEQKMKLQADPTVKYVLEQAGKTRKKIYYRDLEVDSPYNTYKYEGLPPTPICSPSLSAIEAVLNPAVTDYFFFFAGKDGRHIFSQTYSQHLSKQREYKRANGR